MIIFLALSTLLRGLHTSCCLFVALSTDWNGGRFDSWNIVDNAVIIIIILIIIIIIIIILIIIVIVIIISRRGSSRRGRIRCILWEVIFVGSFDFFLRRFLLLCSVVHGILPNIR